jgi:hypothetical protein
VVTAKMAATVAPMLHIKVGSMPERACRLGRLLMQVLDCPDSDCMDLGKVEWAPKQIVSTKIVGQNVIKGINVTCDETSQTSIATIQ